MFVCLSWANQLLTERVTHPYLDTYIDAGLLRGNQVLCEGCR